MRDTRLPMSNIEAYFASNEELKYKLLRIMILQSPGGSNIPGVTVVKEIYIVFGVTRVTDPWSA